MYYLIAKEQTAKEVHVAEAEAAQKLTEGLELLRRYIYEQYTEGPQKAYEIFSRIRSEQPTPELRIAYLYEGIALDLMERHDEAISRFDYLAANTTDEQLKNKAIYNKGISLFREYNPESLEEAIKVFEKLIGQKQKLVDHPIKALALAAKANAIAHRPIFWQEIIFKDKSRDGADLVFQDRSRDDAETHKLKALAQKIDIPGENNTVIKDFNIIQEWVRIVEQIASELEGIYKASKNNKDWDPISSEQLNWAIFNARGNVYLNCANNFYVQPYVDDKQEPKLRDEYLKEAYKDFQRCQLILPAGVETLMNLATVQLSLSKTADARTYADAAIRLNPNYEYAYYRKAQSLDQENRPDKVVEVLKAFAKERTPRIRRFKDLYDKYSVELART